jgi:hypothetical protein
MRVEKHLFKPHRLQLQVPGLSPEIPLPDFQNPATLFKAPFLESPPVQLACCPEFPLRDRVRSAIKRAE